jgi:carotenoid cleavage dioxygenase-like enzyme
MPYRWDDNYGARLGVLRRDDPYGEVRWFEVDPCYVFHVANAYDRGSSIVLQAVQPTKAAAGTWPMSTIQRATVATS